MTEHTVTLEAVKGQPLEEFLQDIVKKGVTLTVILPDGEGVVIEPKPALKPLPELEGRVPDGWKEAVYA